MDLTGQAEQCCNATKNVNFPLRWSALRKERRKEKEKKRGKRKKEKREREKEAIKEDHLQKLIVHASSVLCLLSL